MVRPYEALHSKIIFTLTQDHIERLYSEFDQIGGVHHLSLFFEISMSVPGQLSSGFHNKSGHLREYFQVKLKQIGGVGFFRFAIAVPAVLPDYAKL